ncbi:hypothetical protein D3C75_948360 [compost metagenome]
MQVRIHIPHQVAFVTAQRPLGAQLGDAVDLGKVFIPFTLFGHGFIIQPAGQGIWHAQLATVRPAGINPLIMARQINHPARMLRTALLYRDRDRLVLSGFTLTGIHHDAEIVINAHLTLVVQPGLSL